jgi:hypothetical protein
MLAAAFAPSNLGASGSDVGLDLSHIQFLSRDSTECSKHVREGIDMHWFTPSHAAIAAATVRSFKPQIEKVQAFKAYR